MSKPIGALNRCNSSAQAERFHDLHGDGSPMIEEDDNSEDFCEEVIGDPDEINSVADSLNLRQVALDLDELSI